MRRYPKNIIVMKVGPHSDMNLSDIIISKQNEENLHGVHYWGYSGVFCHPKKVQEFCKNSKKENNKAMLILIETKSNYDSKIGYINSYSDDGKNFQLFSKPVQLQGATFSFVCKNIKEVDQFSLSNYNVVGGKNDGKPLTEHLKFRVNKSFASLSNKMVDENKCQKVLEVELIEPYAIWLK
ncbi:MAG: hypothetical protein PHQ89_01015 [Bacilli bacterium]|nr:hypothetical protein [Bacilli bacterium]